MYENTDIRRISTDQLVARSFPGFQKTGILNTLDKLAWKAPLILKGPKGAGKTLNIEQWAFERKVPFLRKSCTADTGDRHLLGAFTLKSFDESYFTLGVLATAIDVANQTGRCVLVLEEINALNEEAQKAVNSIADYRREVDLPHVGAVYRLAEAVVAPGDGKVIEVLEIDEHQTTLVVDALGEAHDWKVAKSLVQVKEGDEVKAGQVLVARPTLWIVGTMNPGYGGTYDLNEDFRSRFKFIEVMFMDDKTEQAILCSKFPSKPSAEEMKFIASLQSLAKETRGGKYGYGLSTRDLEQVVEDYLSFASVPLSLKMLEGKFDAQYTADLRGRVKSVFGADLTTVSLW
jgi:MoxR-like ATPase